MSEEYEIIFITDEGRAIINKKTRKVYHSEFEIIEEKNKEIDRLNNIITKLEKWLLNEYSKYNGAIRISNVLDKLKELKENNK